MPCLVQLVTWLHMSDYHNFFEQWKMIFFQLAFNQDLELSFEFGAFTCSSAMRLASCFALVITISRLRRSLPQLVKESEASLAKTINTLALISCFCYRDIFQNGVNTFSKMVNHFLPKNSKFRIFPAVQFCSKLQHVDQMLIK